MLQRLGEGGMGEVWLADQEHPVRRLVAVKVIKAGMDSKQVIARFEAERQALALMDHPGIATVFDGGTTAEGRPYFAMEYVKGVPITVYCDQHRLPMRERLLLFGDVCDAVQHAHQKGVIHRDLKPSNVLVTIRDERAVPKIIDFGIAKAIAQPLNERSVFTELGMLVGTIEYMSPEQAEMSGLDVDTRTDVYALGVMLYELLTGALPLDGQMMRGAGLDQIRRTIREKDPPRPSTRVTQLGPAAIESARNRQLEPARLAGQLRGDLDWITMRALDKDRTRRYATANALAMDVRRHLDNEPVTAGPPGGAYRARKFVRRHRAGVGAAATLVVVLVTFSAALVVQAQRVARERDRANREAARANQEAAAAKQVSDFLVGLFSVSDPSEARGRSITAREILDRGAARVRTEVVGNPPLQARLLATIGSVYGSLGLWSDAGPLLTSALEIRERALGEEHPDTLASLSLVGSYLSSRGRYVEAEAAYRRGLAISRRVRPDDPTTLKFLRNLGAVLVLEQKLPEGVSVLQDALALTRRIEGERAPATLTLLNNLAAVRVLQGKPEDAWSALQEALQVSRETLGADHPKTLNVLFNLGETARRLGHLHDALELLGEAEQARRRVLGADHPETLRTSSAIGLVRLESGEIAEARDRCGEVLAVQRRVLPSDHPDLVGTLTCYATALNRLQRFAEAEPLLKEAVAIRPDLESRIDACEANLELGKALAGQRRFAVAEPSILDGYSKLAALAATPERWKRSALEDLVRFYDNWGKPDKAAEWRKKLPN